MPTSHADAPVVPADLLLAYRPETFFLASPEGVLLAEDPGPALTSLDDARAALATAGTGAVLTGAVPFDPSAPTRLAVSRTVRRGLPWHAATPPVFPPARRARWSWLEDDGQDEYLAGVKTALEYIHTTGLRKVVLARRLELGSDRPIRAGELIGRLAAGDPYGYTFAADLGGRTLIGASPELLVSRRDGVVVANPLAGSAPRHPDPVQDGRNATRLLSSGKDLREHEDVVTAVADGLAPLCKNLTVPHAPELLPTRTMWHLSTRITGEPADGVTALDLALALHPTPAVCGSPTESARQLIGELEPFDRGFYTGLVGWTDEAGDGEWVLAIRSGVICGNSLRLYAEAGIVDGSEPDSELAETSAKFRTFLLALGVGEPG